MFRRWRVADPLWLVVVPLLLLSWGAYVTHLLTGWQPSRVAFELLGLDVFWYGIIITGGLILGAWATARLAERQGRRALEAAVPASARSRPLSKLDLPEALTLRPRRRKVETLGELLERLARGPAALGLKPEESQQLETALQADPDIRPDWLGAPAWANWNPDHVWSALIWIVILGVIGGRLYHILTPSPSMAAVGINSPLDYLREPYLLINLRRGGLGIYGALAGGLVGVILYTRRRRLDTLAWADLAVVGLSLGQVFGRWGNFVNQELYGRPTSLPWAVAIDPAHRLDGYTGFTHFHPAFLYESLWSLLTFAILWRLARRQPAWLQRGDLLAFYFIAFGTGRVLAELVRLDSRTLTLGGLDLGLPVATAVSLAVALGMLGWLLVRHRRPRGATGRRRA